MHKKAKIYFIHEGKAAYPEIAAYRSYLSRWFESEELSEKEAAGRSDISESVCWYIMGFYPGRLPARLVIHDYRSLSTGLARQLKDRLKSLVNAKPDIRIFQNEGVREALGFADQTQAIMLPMGVPDFITASRSEPHERVADYCYIGAMSAERQSHLMIDSFLKRFASDRTLTLYGPHEDYLVRRYKKNPNIRFHGSVPQAALFDILTRVGACVCYFPNHYPHLLQTPTKMLEYAALGLRIIANDQAQCVATSRQYSIKCLWGSSSDMFAMAPDEIDWEDNRQVDVRPMLWSNVIKRSGIWEAIMAHTASGVDSLSEPEVFTD